RLFKRASDYLTARATLEEPIPRADAIDPAVPVELADVIAKALSRDRAARYADAAEVARALEAAMAPHGGLAAPAEIAAAVASTEELTAQRTRQARVLGEARAREPAPEQPASELKPQGSPAPTRAIRRSDREPAAAPAMPAAAPEVPAAASEEAPPAEPAERPTPSAQIWRWMPAAASAGVAGAVVAIVLALGSRPGGGGSGGGDGKAGQAPAAITGVGVGTMGAVQNGLLSIDSTPHATIFVDGVELGVTPIVRRPLESGRHRLRAVLADGRARELPVDIPAGQLAPLILLT